MRVSVLIFCPGMLAFSVYLSSSSSSESELPKPSSPLRFFSFLASFLAAPTSLLVCWSSASSRRRRRSASTASYSASTRRCSAGS
jgi:hypothetical protein